MAVKKLSQGGLSGRTASEKLGRVFLQFERDLAGHFIAVWRHGAP
jgi:hypothetical protein